jgi:hypothetical protein
MTEEKVCIKCNIVKTVTHFGRQSRDANRIRNVCHSCVYKSRKDSGYLIKNKHRINKQTENWKHKNPTGSRFRAMRGSDKKRGHFGTMTREEYNTITSKPCYYCGTRLDIGVDRKDNTIGHTYSNALPCCHKCNYLLSDLPMEAKEILKISLTKIKQLKIIEKWVVPTLRRRKADQ